MLPVKSHDNLKMWNQMSRSLPDLYPIKNVWQLLKHYQNTLIGNITGLNHQRTRTWNEVLFCYVQIL